MRQHAVNIITIWLYFSKHFISLSRCIADWSFLITCFHFYSFFIFDKTLDLEINFYFVGLLLYVLCHSKEWKLVYKYVEDEFMCFLKTRVISESKVYFRKFIFQYWQHLLLVMRRQVWTRQDMIIDCNRRTTRLF